MKTQPPRAQDLATADYVKTWGVMPSGSFVKELAEMLKLYMPTDRIVSGAFFKLLSDVKYPMGQVPAHLVNATLFTHAASSACVHDGFARYISKPDIALIAAEKTETLC